VRLSVVVAELLELGVREARNEGDSMERVWCGVELRRTGDGRAYMLVKITCPPTLSGLHMQSTRICLCWQSLSKSLRLIE
jgi:hypothetical protein